MTAPSPEGEAPLGRDEIRRRAASGVLAVAVRNVAVRGLGLLGTIVLARLLPPRDFGLLALGFTLVVFGHALASGGLGAELIRRERAPSRQELASVLGFQLAITGTIAAAAVVVGILVGGAAGVASVMAVSVPLVVLRTPNQILLEREMRFSDLTFAEVAETGVYNALAIGLVVAGLGVWGVAAATLAQGLIGSVLITRRGPAGLLAPQLHRGAIGPLYRFGVRFQAAALVAAVRDYGINVVIALTAGVAAVGIWSLAFRLFQTILLLLQAVWRVSFSAMSRLTHAGEADARVLERTLRLMSIAVGGLAVLLGGTAPALVPAIFGPGWSETVDVLPLGAAALMISGPISTALAGFLYAQGEAGVMLRSAAAQAVCWLGGAALLAPSLGATSGGVGMLVGALATAATLTHAARRHVRGAEPSHHARPGAGRGVRGRRGVARRDGGVPGAAGAARLRRGRQRGLRRDPPRPAPRGRDGRSPG